GIGLPYREFVYTQSSIYGGSVPASVDFLQDGLISPNQVVATNFSAKDWVQIDMGGLYPIDRVVVGSPPGSTGWGGYLNGVRIEASSDGSNWSTIDDPLTPFDGSPARIATITVTPTSCRYLRVFRSNYIAISEFYPLEALPSAISLSVAPAAVTEDSGTALLFSFSRTGVLNIALTVHFSVGGTAIFLSDYSQSGAASFSSTSGTVSFAAGAATATLTLQPYPDALVEADETVALTLLGGVNYTIATPEAVSGTISNDDLPAISLAVSPASVSEDIINQNLLFTFTRTGPITAALTVNFSVGGTATLGSDYSQSGATSFSTTSGTVTFASGAATAVVTVDPTDDNESEGDETVVLTLAAGSGYTIATAAAVSGTILLDYEGVALLLRLRGSDGSTSFPASIGAVTVVRHGNTVISTAESIFHGSAAYFDGTDDGLELLEQATGNPAANSALGDFSYTYELLLYPQSFGSNRCVFDAGGHALILNSTGYPQLMRHYQESGQMGISSTATLPLTLNQWNHLAISRWPGRETVNGMTAWEGYFINGQPAGIRELLRNAFGNLNQALPAAAFHRIGAPASNSLLRLTFFVTQGMRAYVSELRVTRHSVQYSGAFTPPTAPFSGPA
ncbi:MAG: discoidin domain-containing protein, partial [Cyanobacteriota bacterium]